MHATAADSSSIDRYSLLSGTIGRLRVVASHPTVNHCLALHRHSSPPIPPKPSIAPLPPIALLRASASHHASSLLCA
ncbi:hypothetical protein GUJ93_ZPchr0013g34433 [Zizania palustris]|uniref:Uncharacterized protein n=1 Tax=Zizania palustris TaxID=103762 RepID=A0A8J5WZN8_ZIZPA|nr:hypothetical protein GUJ93_ZPchr0013g34433 [Zizania palustris]